MINFKLKPLSYPGSVRNLSEKLACPGHTLTNCVVWNNERLPKSCLSWQNFACPGQRDKLTLQTLLPGHFYVILDQLDTNPHSPTLMQSSFQGWELETWDISHSLWKTPIYLGCFLLTSNVSLLWGKCCNLMWIISHYLRMTLKWTL